MTTFDDSVADAIEMAYSDYAGMTWNPPVALDTTAGDTAPDSSINDRGDGWVAWLDGDALSAKAFSVPVVPGISADPVATAGGSRMSLTVRCTAACATTLAVGLPTGRVTLATGTTALPRAGVRKVTLRLTRRGRALLHHHHRLTATLTLSDQTGARTITDTRPLHITDDPAGSHRG